MKAITLPPLEAWALVEGVTNYISYGRKTPYRGEILVGTGKMDEPALDAYVGFYMAAPDTVKFPHPVEWAKAFPSQAYIATATLVDYRLYENAWLDQTEKIALLPRKWLIKMSGVQRLETPLFSPQQPGVRDFDMETMQPARYHPLTKAQIDDLIGLCERVEHAQALGDAYLFYDHWIRKPAYSKLRKKLFKSSDGRLLIRRKTWRKALKQEFPDIAFS